MKRLIPACLIAMTFAAASSALADDVATQTQLPKMTVTDTEDAQYTIQTATSGTKTATPLIETPMAIQIVTKEVIEDRQERTSLEAVKNLSGVQPSTYTFYDQFLIRGFDSGYGTTFRNGLQLRGINEAVNMAFVDHIEVVKGPSSMLYGRIEPGGFVNVVTRKPEAEATYRVDVQGGNWGFARVTADATGKVTDDGSLLYRVTGDFDKAGSWVDFAHRNNKALAATLAWRPNDRLDVTLQLEHYDYKATWLDAGIPAVGNRPASVPRNFSILFPESWSDYPYVTKRTLAAFEWTYRITDAWKLTNRFHYVNSREDQQGVYATWWEFDGTSTIPGINFTHTVNWTRETLGTNLDLTGEFHTGGLKHTLLVGADWASFRDDTPGSTGDIPGAGPFDIFHPTYPNYIAQLQQLAAADATNVSWRDRSRDAGLYVQDQLDVGDRWKVLVGGRYDQATDAYADVYGERGATCYPTCTGYPVTDYATDRAFSPHAGVLYMLSSSASIYASYSKSFGSANGRDNLGNTMKPQIGTQYEIGFKANFLDDAITTSATLFTLTKSNIVEYDPASFFPRVVGEARSRGLEVDVAGQVSSHVSLIGSYTYDQAIITKDPYSGTLGHRLSGVAPQVLSLWAKYESSRSAAQGWSIALGSYFSAQRQGDDGNAWQLPGYGRLDGMVGYRTTVGRTRVSGQLNVNNVLDRVYFDRGGSGVSAYGAPRTYIASVRAEF